MSKTAIVVFSDPHAESDEALGRVFNALFLTHILKGRDEDVSLIFQGAGARWPGRLVQIDHPAHALFQSVADKVAGVCGGCADVFGSTADVEAAGLPLVRDEAIPGTSGILDLTRYLTDGWRLVTF